MITTQQGWLLLVLSISGTQGAARIRLWRFLKGAGAVAIRDGVYVLPASPELEAIMREQQREVTNLGGTALLFRVPAGQGDDTETLPALFDRTEEYAALHESIQEFTRALSGRAEHEARRLLRQLKRELANTEAIDFFPGTLRASARLALMEAEACFIDTFSPGEPTPEQRPIAILRREDYMGRLWATRSRPWADRLASAWFIRRFIDADAKIAWISDPSRCPKDAIGFDFDGAPFTHVGTLVTLEVLIASFNLAGDAALRRLAGIIHGLDLGVPTVPEAAGFEAFLTGARDLFTDDDALLAQVSQTLDILYAAFLKNLQPKESEPQ